LPDTRPKAGALPEVSEAGRLEAGGVYGMKFYLMFTVEASEDRISHERWELPPLVYTTLRQLMRFMEDAGARRF
jgi:hypothetical protein